jgi:hypothetical protein
MEAWRGFSMTKIENKGEISGYFHFGNKHNGHAK